MRFVPETETSARLELSRAGFELASEGMPISPYHLLAASLSTCTVLTITSWAENAGIEIAPLTVHLSWEQADEKPARITRLEMEIRWPGLPSERAAAVERVADMCPIHATLARAAEVSTRVVALPVGAIG